MGKVELEDLKVKRDENDNPLPKDIETSMGEVGIKPPTIRDLEVMQEISEKDDEEAQVGEIIDILQDLIIDPDLSSLDKEEIKNEFDFTKIRDIFNDIMAHIQGVDASQIGADTKN